MSCETSICMEKLHFEDICQVGQQTTNQYVWYSMIFFHTLWCLTHDTCKTQFCQTLSVPHSDFVGTISHGVRTAARHEIRSAIQVTQRQFLGQRFESHRYHWGEIAVMMCVVSTGDFACYFADFIGFWLLSWFWFVKIWPSCPNIPILMPWVAVWMTQKSNWSQQGPVSVHKQ